jgi:hypothetical protein
VSSWGFRKTRESLSRRDRLSWVKVDSLHLSAEFVRYYCHKEFDNRLIDPGEEVSGETGEIKCRDRLGGMLKYYYRDGA